ncbi:MAG: hypothetical protein H8E37_03865, partial [Planctomycetes bacterium]|nr:hypothetical protein [Planctomycetota bacterium]
MAKALSPLRGSRAFRSTTPLADARGYVLSPLTRLFSTRLFAACLLAIAVSLSGCGSEGGPDGSAANDPGGEESGGGALSSFFDGGDESEEAGEEEATSSAGGVRKTGDTITNSIGMKLAVVPPGEFMMGSPDTEEKRSGDESRHAVKLSKPIFMGAHEVTQAEFQKV